MKEEQQRRWDGDTFQAGDQQPCGRKMTRLSRDGWEITGQERGSWGMCPLSDVSGRDAPPGCSSSRVVSLVFGCKHELVHRRSRLQQLTRMHGSAAPQLRAKENERKKERSQRSLTPQPRTSCCSIQQPGGGELATSEQVEAAMVAEDLQPLTLVWLPAAAADVRRWILLKKSSVSTWFISTWLRCSTDAPSCSPL